MDVDIDTDIYRYKWQYVGEWPAWWRSALFNCFSVIFHINCISLWLINDCCSSSWMRSKLRSWSKMCSRWRTKQEAAFVVSRQQWSECSAWGPWAIFTPVKTFSPTYKNISALMKPFASPGGQSQWFSPDLLRCRLLLPLRSNGSGNCGKVAFHPPKQN